MNICSQRTRSASRTSNRLGPALASIFRFRGANWGWADSGLAVVSTIGVLQVVAHADGRQSGLAALCGGFAALYGFGEPWRRRLAIVAAVGAGMVVVMVACSFAEASPIIAGLVLALTAASATFALDVCGAGQPGMIMLLVTGSVALGLPGASPEEIGDRAVCTAFGALTAVVLTGCLLLLRRGAGDVTATPTPALSALTHSARMGVATLATACVAVVAGIAHWQWAPIATAAVLQGADTTMIVSRAVQRTVGTVVGVLITAAILVTDPPFLVVVLVCAFCIGASQLLFPQNYALGIICITPLAFLLPGIVTGSSDSYALVPRIWATALGAILGMAAWLATAEANRRLRTIRGATSTPCYRAPPDQMPR